MYQLPPQNIQPTSFVLYVHLDAKEWKELVEKQENSLGGEPAAVYYPPPPPMIEYNGAGANEGQGGGDCTVLDGETICAQPNYI